MKRQRTYYYDYDRHTYRQNRTGRSYAKAVARQQKDQLKHWKLTAVILIVVCILTIAFAMILTTSETRADEQAEVKSYVSYEIQAGDTLWSIASDIYSSQSDIKRCVAEIKMINGISEDLIHAGCHIIVPQIDSAMV
ncbi:MAG: LysM peptidoglycan-binding domain-containing protein [Lachnospiraceae bacterium]|nr:LysM peptidoglycan-binding domain-containing protein [Lachnospiraceae bacterium]